MGALSDGQDEAGRPAPAAESMRLVAAGDTEAFEDLYDRYASAVYGIARRVLQNSARAEEVAQEVFLEVWHTAAKFDPAKGTILTWILTMAHRRAVDHIRSAQASANRDERAAWLDHRPAYDEVAEQVEARSEIEQLRRALAALTATQRQSLLLAYYDGHTYREVAELLGLPLGTVKTRIRDGLIQLRDHMAASEWTSPSGAGKTPPGTANPATPAR